MTYRQHGWVVRQYVPRKEPRGHRNVRETFGVSGYARSFLKMVDIPGEGAREEVVVSAARATDREGLQRKPAGTSGKADSAEGGYMYPKLQLFELDGPSWRGSLGGQVRT